MPRASAARTSESDPLMIDVVTVGPAGGRIGMTLCPGKKQRGAISGDWDRDLGTDLDAVARFGATVLVSLMEAHELDELAVPLDLLGSELAAREIGSVWLPIADVSIPDERFHERWPEIGARLRETLERGATIVIHCKGGLGRTGMIAAQLLVELGETPASAIERVRAARGGTIETSEQERYVLALRGSGGAT